MATAQINTHNKTHNKTHNNTANKTQTNKKAVTMLTTVSVPSLIPTGLQYLFDQAPVLITESKEAYLALLQSSIDSINPRDHVEWLWTKDYADLSWEVARYHQATASILNIGMRKALENIAVAVHGINGYIIGQRWADEWFAEKAGPKRVIELLSEHGIEAHAPMGQALLAHCEALARIEGMLAAAESRRNAIVRQIGEHRKLAKRQPDEIIDAEFSEAPAIAPAES